jgi:hypothetical protein
MVEVQVQDASVITADAAAPAGLIDERPLDSLKPARDCLADAALAAPPSGSAPSARVERELR